MFHQVVDPSGPKKCPVCGITFHGRDNKDHCSKRCTNKAYYQKNKPRKEKERQLTKALRQNEGILQRLAERCSNAHRVSINLLNYEGFDFTRYTGVGKADQGGATVYWLFTLGWSKNSDGTYCLHERMV